MSLVIGSGDVPRLLMGKQTKGYRELWKKFIDDNPPHYNAKASPIDALRTGAILEDVYGATLDESYYFQVKKECEEMDVIRVTLDFAKMEGGIVDFDELKTIYITDFIEIIRPVLELSQEMQQAFFKKKFKNNYNQVQCQLFACGLDSCNLVFLSVESYDDDVNRARVIEDKDVAKFRITREESAIEVIKERSRVFQDVKDNFSDINFKGSKKES